MVDVFINSTIIVHTQGNYSEGDRQNWTPELKKVLNFDQTQALQVDNGKVACIPV